MLLVLILGLLMNAVALPLAAKRVLFLHRVITSGQPAPDRIEGVTGRLGAALKRQAVEVLGQKKLLKWSVPGAAHFFVFWAFLILATVYLEAYGSLLKLLFTGGDGPMDWAIPFVGHWAVLGFAQDFIAMMALFGLAAFVAIRVRNAPDNLGRKSRFYGSHLSGAWITLFMIFNVIWTMFLFRGASSALGNLPYESGAFISIGVGNLLDGISEEPLEALEGVGLLLHIGVMLVFLIFVLNSKHLHIFLAPLNVLFGRQPVALGAMKPMMSGGKPIDLADLEELDEETTLGVGSIEDFTWKGLLDFTTCTECGRCQSQCPAWNTEKPLSPKLLIMGLRDHAIAKAPYLLATDDAAREKLDASVLKEAERPLVGETEGEWAWEPTGGAVIDNDVLWSCTSCGACVNQCPVDIEHVDHIMDMRRYQVLVESNFPAELNGLFRGLENKGNPWNMSPKARMDWAKDLPFDVKVVGEDIESLDEVDWLFWVGCAGAYEDRAKKTTRAVAELLDLAGVSFGVLGNGETCTGDPARRAGNEFVYQGLAAQNIETFKEMRVKKVVSTCAHCFNTLKNEYSELGIELEVVHHTQLLNQLVREKKLTPVAAGNGGPKRSITYHDPCFIGRHNQVYTPPRELLNIIPDAELTEMPRNSEKSFCCGAGGARMWMEENIGQRINVNRTKEAVATGADQIAVACPFCRVMLDDGLTSEKSEGNAREEVEVLDVAQMLLASVKGESKPSAKKTAAKAADTSGASAAATATIERTESKAAGTSDEEDTKAEATKAEPEAGDATQTDETVTDTEDVGPAAKASGGSSLFDMADDSEDAEDSDASAADSADDSAEAKAEPEPKAEPEATAEPEAEPEAKAEPEARKSESSDEGFGGGSLFDVSGDDSAEESADEADTEPKTGDNLDPSQDHADTGGEPEAETDEPESSDEGFGGSLFDIGGDDDEPQAKAPASEDSEAKAEPETEDTAEPEPEPEPEDKAEPEPEPEPEGKAEPEPEPEPEPEAEAEDKAAEEPAEEPKAKDAPTSSGTASTPGTEIPEGGSLFDIEAPAEEMVSKPAPAAEEPDSADDTADKPAGEAGDESGDEAGDEAEPEAKAEDAAADSTTDGEVDRSEDGADTDVEADEDADETPVTSLRDIKAKFSGDQAEPEAETDDAADVDAADVGTADESEDEAHADDTDESERSEDEKKPKPASSGDTHQPRTDAEIGEGGSLFDL